MLADDLAPEVFHIAAREASESDERGGTKVATVHPLPNDGPNQTGTQSGWGHCADRCGAWGHGYRPTPRATRFEARCSA